MHPSAPGSQPWDPEARRDSGALPSNRALQDRNIWDPEARRDSGARPDKRALRDRTKRRSLKMLFDNLRPFLYPTLSDLSAPGSQPLGS